MSVDGAIKLAEKTASDMAAKKEADRIKSLKPEELKAEEIKAAEAKKIAEEKAILEADEKTLDDAGKTRKAEALAAKKKRESDEEARILKAKDEDLSDEDRDRKPELIKKAHEAREAEREANVQKRIDEVIAELKVEKAERSKDKGRIAELDAELKKLKGVSDKPAVESEVEKLEAVRIEKYIEEDRSLPKEKRREMDDDELTEWLVEDMVAAQRWLARQENRRERERNADADRLTKKEIVNPEADAVVKSQSESKVRAAKKYPDLAKQLDIKDRLAELKEEGKTREEAAAILNKERPATKIVAQILREDSDKYLLAENGPEMLIEEVNRRMAKGSKDKGETQEERDTRIAEEAAEAERVRQANLPESLRSNHGGAPETKLNDSEKKQWELYKKNFPKKTFADFRKMQERRERSGA